MMDKVSPAPSLLWLNLHPVHKRLPNSARNSTLIIRSAHEKPSLNLDLFGVHWHYAWPSQQTDYVADANIRCPKIIDPNTASVGSLGGGNGVDDLLIANIDGRVGIDRRIRREIAALEGAAC